MALFGLSNVAAASRAHAVLPNGTGYWKSTFISASGGEMDRRPNGFLVEQEGNSEIQPHFHKSNQFQVFVHGEGHLGKHKIAPVTVHYTNADSPYGPLLSGENGLHYYTLRDDYDAGARFIPGAISELRKGNRRYATSDPAPAPDPVAIERIERTSMIPYEPDGLGALRVDAPSGAMIETTIGPTINDRYLLVLAGAIDAKGQHLSSGSCIFIPRDEVPTISVPVGGSSLLLMQFPTRSREASATPA